MKRFKLLAVALLMVVGVGLAFVGPAFAADTQTEINIKEVCDANPESSICKSEIHPNEQGMTHVISLIINIMIYIAGIIAVIVIVMSGIKFASSRGDSGATKKAQATLFHAVIGLVIVVMAFAIVNFVFSMLLNTNSSSNSQPTVETQATCKAKNMGFDAGPPPKCIPVP